MCGPCSRAYILAALLHSLNPHTSPCTPVTGPACRMHACRPRTSGRTSCIARPCGSQDRITCMRILMHATCVSCSAQLHAHACRARRQCPPDVAQGSNPNCIRREVLQRFTCSLNARRTRIVAKQDAASDMVRNPGFELTVRTGISNRPRTRSLYCAQLHLSQGRSGRRRSKKSYKTAILNIWLRLTASVPCPF